MTPLPSGLLERLRAARGARSGGHLHDRRLLALLDGASAAADRGHLAACPDCADRLAGLRGFLDALRWEADAACDEALSPARLATGRRRIRRRVERAAGRDSPRVLRFPGPARPQRAAPWRSRWWMGAAAAAGLVIGLTLGRLDARLDGGVADAQAGIAAAGTTAGLPADPGSHAGDELFMQELERALTSPRIPALAALDELTPRLYEVAVDVR